VVYLVKTLTQIFHGICRWKNWNSFKIWRRYRQKCAAYGKMYIL